MKFTDKLENLSACDEAIKWVGKRGIVTAWRDCKRGDWMLWLADRLDIDRKLLALAACDCAETALQYVPEGEDRPAKCIQTTRNWCNGTASRDEVSKAQRAAYDAYTAACAACAAAGGTIGAAYAACAAAGGTIGAAYAAAADAAYAAAGDAAASRRGAQLLCADLVRKRIPVSIIQGALK